MVSAVTLAWLTRDRSRAAVPPLPAPGEALLELLRRGETRLPGGGPRFARPLPPLPQPEPEELAALCGGPSCLGPAFDAASVRRFPKFGNCTLAEDVVRLADPKAEAALARILHAVPGAAQAAGCDVELNRFDLFHGHLVQLRPGLGLGLLLHASEYPAFDAEAFPVFLGYCQEGSPLRYNAERMRHRNIVVLLPPPGQEPAGEVKGFVLDAASPPVEAIIPSYARAPLYTVYEDSLGVPLADVYVLPDASEPLACSLMGAGQWLAYSNGSVRSRL